MNSMYYQNDYDRAYREASRRIRARVGFYQHLAVYLAVNAFLVLIYIASSWAMNDFGFPWFIFPLGGWGIGIVSHGVSVFMTKSHMEQQMIDAELRRMGVTLPLPSYSLQDSPVAPPTSYAPPVNEMQQEHVLR